MPPISMPSSTGLAPIAPWAASIILAVASRSLDSESMRNSAERTTVSPSFSPSSTWVNPSLAGPRRTGRGSNLPGPRTTNTCSREPLRTTASVGITRASGWSPAWMWMSAKTSGFRIMSGLSNSIRTRTVRDLSSA